MTFTKVKRRFISAILSAHLPLQYHCPWEFKRGPWDETDPKVYSLFHSTFINIKSEISYLLLLLFRNKNNDRGCSWMIIHFSCLLIHHIKDWQGKRWTDGCIYSGMYELHWRSCLLPNLTTALSCFCPIFLQFIVVPGTNLHRRHRLWGQRVYILPTHHVRLKKLTQTWLFVIR